jgi:ATP-binding cassette subfamily C protein LapB
MNAHSPKMLPPELLRRMFNDRGLQFDATEFAQVVEDANANALLVPAGKLEFILKRLGCQNFSVGQGSLQQLNSRNLPGMIFLNGTWCYLTTVPSGLAVEDPDSAELMPLDQVNMPVAVVLWLKAVSHNYLTQSVDQYRTAKALIIAMALKQKRWLIDVCAATLLVNVFAVVTSLFAMQVYDRVVPTLAYYTLYALVVGVVGVYLFDWVLKLLRSHLLDGYASQVDTFISEYIYRHLLHVQLDKVPQSLGTLSAQVSGLDGARQFFTSSVVFVLIDLPFALLFLGVMYVIGGPISVVYLGFFAVSMAMAMVMQKKSQVLVKKYISRSNERMGMLIDSIRGNESIRSAGASGRFVSEWNAINQAMAVTSIKQKAISSFSNYSASMFGGIAYVVAIVVGVHLIGSGGLTQGALIACSILGGRVLGPISQAVGYMLQYENVRQGMEMVDKLLEIPSERQAGQRLVSPELKPHSLSLEAVEFSYPNAKVKTVAISDLQFSAGERVALLGTVGSGKSTLLKLLAGLFKPTSGRIKAGMVDLWEIDPDYISRNLAYLPQSVDLFKGTLKSNLALGRDVQDTMMLSVCADLGLDKVASKSEKGLDLPINEGGSGLSGGQRQLVGLGRVCLADPVIWLLDEPTASLDSETQERVFKALQARIKPSDILIFATHNSQHAVQFSSRIIVMDNGSVVKDVPTRTVELRRKAA